MEYRHRRTVKAEQYTNPASVHRIMDLIGTKGVNNTEGGLYIYQSNPRVRLKDHLVNKGQWIVLNDDGIIFVVNDDDFQRSYEALSVPIGG